MGRRGKKIRRKETRRSRVRNHCHLFKVNEELMAFMTGGQP